MDSTASKANSKWGAFQRGLSFTNKNQLHLKDSNCILIFFLVSGVPSVAEESFCARLCDEVHPHTRKGA